MRRSDKSTDRLGVALLLGALIGFVIGGVIGFSSTSLDAPVIWPFAGAAIGVLVTGVIAAIVARLPRPTAERPDPLTEALDPHRFRQESRQGWVDGIDLASDPPPRPPQRQPVLGGRRREPSHGSPRRPRAHQAAARAPSPSPEPPGANPPARTSPRGRASRRPASAARAGTPRSACGARASG